MLSHPLPGERVFCALGALFRNMVRAQPIALQQEEGKAMDYFLKVRHYAFQKESFTRSFL